MYRKAIRRVVTQALALVLASSLFGCAGVAPREFATYRAVAARPATGHGLPLAAGQIVVSESGGAMSLLFRLFEDGFPRYLHAGVLAREDDAFYVYHAVGTLKPSFGGAPTDAVRGSVRREPLLRYLAGQRITAVYDPPADVDAARVVAFVRDAYQRRIPFDAYFDPADHQRLYCAELVALALEAGGAPPVPRRARRAHRSLAVVLDWLKIHAAELVSTADLVDPSRQVALISRRYSPREIALHLAAREELHRRFTDDQRLGHLFVWTGTKLDFRESVTAFERAALALRATETELDAESARSEVAALATRLLGVFPSVASARFAQVPRAAQ